MYEKFIAEPKSYSKAIRILSKGYNTTFSKSGFSCSSHVASDSNRKLLSASMSPLHKMSVITVITPSKLEAILKQVQIAIAKTNQDYELVLNRLYLYYDMKLVMFGIDNQKKF